MPVDDHRAVLEALAMQIDDLAEICDATAESGHRPQPDNYWQGKAEGYRAAARLIRKSKDH